MQLIIRIDHKIRLAIRPPVKVWHDNPPPSMVRGHNCRVDALFWQWCRLHAERTFSSGLKTKKNKDSLIFKVTLYMCSLIPYRIFIFHGIHDSKGRVIFFVSDYSDKNSKLKSRVSNEHRVHKMIL